MTEDSKTLSETDSYDKALDTPCVIDGFKKKITLRKYFHALLDTLWTEGEGFSGKRPFGNSGWEYDVYAFLVKSGAIVGDFDEDDCLLDFDRKTANKLVPKLIAHALGVKP